jgi:hypothetical protein
MMPLPTKTSRRIQMTFRTTFTIVVIAGAVLGVYGWKGDVHHTRLPFGTTDLSSVQEPLAELSSEERALVEAYVKRSNGDVLPKQFADPDDPLTARTFAEAIELQRTWNVKQQAVNLRVAELRSQREAKLAPLRAMVEASVVKAEVITRNEYQARSDPTFYQRPYQVDTSPAFLTLVRVRNLSSETLVAVRGSLHAIDADAYLPMDLCWIDVGDERSIPSGGSIDLLCGHDYRGASQQQRDFVRNPTGRFRIVWEPRYVKLASGRELETGI